MSSLQGDHSSCLKKLINNGYNIDLELLIK